MSRDLIIVFVDAFPYEEIPRLVRSGRFLTWQRPLRPGFGYSVNVKSELFAGLVPDAAGFLNEWTYRPGEGTVRVRMPAPLWRGLSRSRLLRRGVSKVLSRVLGEDLRNIPLPLLPSLVRRGHNAYESEYENATLFGRYGITRFLYSEHGGDEAAFRALCETIRTSNGPVRAFLAQCDLDHVMHKYGKGTAQYAAAIGRVDERLAELIALLSARAAGAAGRQGRLILVSDHGMAPVTRYVQFAIEDAVAGVGQRYGYFVDATMARVWCTDERVRAEVAAWLESRGLPGHVLTGAERARWGIGSQQFGDVVFLLDEGVMFAPNFFGDKGCKAMHGYWPELPSQLGVLACTTALDTPGAGADASSAGVSSAHIAGADPAAGGAANGASTGELDALSRNVEAVSALRAFEYMSRCAAHA